MLYLIITGERRPKYYSKIVYSLFGKFSKLTSEDKLILLNNNSKLNKNIINVANKCARTLEILDYPEFKEYIIKADKLYFFYREQDDTIKEILELSNSYDKPKREFSDWSRIRKTVLSRDNNKCVRCGWSPTKEEEIANLTIDHICELKDNGERFTLSNLQTLCKRCHKEKNLLIAFIRGEVLVNDGKRVTRSKRHKVPHINYGISKIPLDNYLEINNMFINNIEFKKIIFKYTKVEITNIT